MKYAVFFLALAGVAPLGAVLSWNRRWLKYAVWGMVAALAVYQATAINFFSYEEYRGSSRGMEVSIIYLLALAVLVAAAIRGSLPRAVPSCGAFLYVVYFMLCLPSLGAAENLLFSWMEIWKMIMIYIVYLSVRAYLDMTDGVKDLVKAFAAFSVWNLVLVLADHFSGVYQPHGSFPHQNCLAMGMHLFSGVFFACFIAPARRRPLFVSAAFIASTACIVRTYSRGALAVLPVSFFTVFVLSFVSAKNGKGVAVMRRMLPVAFIGLAGLCAALPRIVERFSTAPESSKNTRIELAMCAREMIADEPWRGVGINNWGIKINPPYEYAKRAGRNTNRGEDFKDGIVETVYLLVGAECGIPALAAMVAWLFSYLFASVRLARRLSGTPYAALPAGLAGGLLATYLQSCLEWVLRQQMNLVVLMMFFALLDHLAASSANRKHETPAGGGS